MSPARPTDVALFARRSPVHPQSSTGSEGLLLSHEHPALGGYPHQEGCPVEAILAVRISPSLQ